MDDVSVRDTKQCPNCGKYYIAIRTPSLERDNLDDEMCPYCSAVNRQSKIWHFKTEKTEQPE